MTTHRPNATRHLDFVDKFYFVVNFFSREHEGAQAGEG